MDLEQVYKSLKAEHDALVQKEQELAAKIRDIKSLRELVASRKLNVTKLQDELNRLLGA
jgi:uncharacterized protein involved in exopolysaccharide biosynthesis